MQLLLDKIIQDEILKYPFTYRNFELNLENKPINLRRINNSSLILNVIKFIA